jgi:hypothetical protein
MTQHVPQTTHKAEVKAEIKAEVQDAVDQAEFTGPVYRTAFEWKALKETPDSAFRGMLIAQNWSDVQRLSEAEYTAGMASAIKSSPDVQPLAHPHGR